VNILVSGGAGFIGSHLVDRMIEDGHSVVILDNLSTGKRENLNPKAIFHHVDISENALEPIFQKEKIDSLFHLAAQVDVRKSVDDPIFDLKTNIIGTLKLFECARKYGVKKIIFSSSGGVIYGETNDPATEENPPNPISPYGVSKLAGEHYLRYYGREYDLKFTILRYANIYGPRQDPFGEAGVVGIFSRQMLKKEYPTLFGFGKMVRDYVYVGDVVNATTASITKGDNEIINIGTGIGTSVDELFQKMKKCTNFSGNPIYKPARPGELNKNILNSRKAEKLLQWRPRTSTDQGILETINWFRNTIE
jgi:UDP-glucose 4-epimerase